MDSLIQVQELYKSYRRDSLEIPVLRNINLEIKEGEFVAFMGPSGSGKTTLLNLIAGIDKPTSGRILIGGIDVAELNETELAVWRSRNVGFIFQFYNLIPGAHGVGKRRVAAHSNSSIEEGALGPCGNRAERCRIG